MFGADTLIDSIPQAVIATDPEGTIVSWNHGAEELYGKNASAVIGRPLAGEVPEDDPLAESPGVFEELRAGRSWSAARRVDHGGGLVFMSARPIRADDGISGFVIVATPLDGFDPPVGEDQRLRQREAQLRQAQQAARIASWGWHIPSDAIEGSVELLEILGLDPAGTLTLTEMLTTYVHPEDRERFAAACHTTRLHGLPLNVEHRFRSPGGERVLHLRGHRILDQQGNVLRIAGVVQDVTERRRLENRLLQAERVSSLGRLAASVAHEFNNVLMGIQPFIDLLSRKAGSDPTVKLAAPRIADAVARGKRITQEILRFTRIAEPSRGAVNAADWLLAFQPELEQLAGPAVTVTVETDPSLTMLADAHQLRQVFANIVVNAHHAMPNGGTLEVRAFADTIRNANDRPIDAVHFTIRDTGVGMPQDTLRYIFEPLFTTKKFGGTGLGLAVASQVVQQHEGHIFAESTPGEGTTFHVLVPSTDPAAATILRSPPTRPRGHNLPNGTSVMLIEDDESVGIGLAALLDLEGISVDWVRFGAEAVARVAEKMPDAVIFDLGLPDVDGLTLYDEIALRWPDLPVLFSTGHGDERLLKKHVVGKHVGYLQKPYVSDALLAELEKLLGAKGFNHRGTEDTEKKG